VAKAISLIQEQAVAPMKDPSRRSTAALGRLLVSRSVRNPAVPRNAKNPCLKADALVARSTRSGRSDASRADSRAHRSATIVCSVDPRIGSPSPCSSLDSRHPV